MIGAINCRVNVLDPSADSLIPDVRYHPARVMGICLLKSFNIVNTIFKKEVAKDDVALSAEDYRTARMILTMGRRVGS
jgi:hypothetical protein